MMSRSKLPGVAEVAMQSGLYAGNRIWRQVSGHLAEKPFRYHDLGSAAYISRGRAVVSAGPLRVGGFLGWWIWLFIHIAFLTGYRNRLGALLTWWLAFSRDIRERTFTTQEIETLRDIYATPCAGQARRTYRGQARPGTRRQLLKGTTAVRPPARPDVIIRLSCPPPRAAGGHGSGVPPGPARRTFQVWREARAAPPDQEEGRAAQFPPARRRP